MKIEIDTSLALELIAPKHCQAVYDLVMLNRNYLSEWHPWVMRMQGVEFIENYVKGSAERNKDGKEMAFVILEENKLVGRIGIYKIDAQNKCAEIGYWIAEAEQGKGIVTRACKGLIEYCFTTLNLNRIEIKCGTKNLKSQKIPMKLKFSVEGILRQAEMNTIGFIDLKLFSLLKEEWVNE